MNDEPDPKLIENRDRLQHVYWLGGGSGAGKTTIARRLAERYGFDVCSTDQLMGDHAQRTDASESPLLAKFKAMNMDERWLNRAPETMLETFHWFEGEGFPLIIEDLLALPPDRPVIVEGFRLLPRLVLPQLKNRRHAVWILPTPEFRRMAFESRGSVTAIVGNTSDPGRALENLLRRDDLFTERVAEEARELGARVLSVDPTMSEDELAEHTALAFGLV